MTFLATVNSKYLDFLDFGSDYNKSRFREWCKKHEGQKLRIELIKPKRSLNANAYYWICLEVIARETGNEQEDLHKYFKGRYLPRKFIKIGGREIQLTGSTADLNTTQFMDYFEKVQIEAAQLGISLPNPEEYKKYHDSAPLL